MNSLSAHLALADLLLPTGRTTRLGSVFSPYLGESLHAPLFDAAEAAAYALSFEDAGLESDPEIEHAPSPSLSPSENLGSSRDSPDTQPLRGIGKNRRSNLKKRDVRNEQRKLAQAARGSSLKACSLKHRSQAAAKSSPNVSVSLADFSPSRPAWLAKPERKVDKQVYSLDTLVSEYGMELIQWTGQETRLLVDGERRVFGILGGIPRAPDWNSVQSDAAAQLEEARQLLSFPTKNLDHRRGDFPVFASGISHGGGREAPGMVASSPLNSPILKKLNHSLAFERIAGFNERLFQTYAPRLHSHYKETLDSVVSYYPHLRKLYKNSAFAANTFNFGPHTVSYPHRDWANLAWGWCAITALGNFDPDFGGHLVLWDIQRVVRFPAGSTVIIPSAMLRHSNTPVRLGETRYSYTQYTSGHVFRWVDNGFMNDTACAAAASKEEKVWREERRQSRWRRGVSMLSTVDEFL